MPKIKAPRRYSALAAAAHEEEKNDGRPLAVCEDDEIDTPPIVRLSVESKMAPESPRSERRHKEKKEKEAKELDPEKEDLVWMHPTTLTVQIVSGPTDFVEALP